MREHVAKQTTRPFRELLRHKRETFVNTSRNNLKISWTSTWKNEKLWRIRKRQSRRLRDNLVNISRTQWQKFREQSTTISRTCREKHKTNYSWTHRTTCCETQHEKFAKTSCRKHKQFASISRPMSHRGREQVANTSQTFLGAILIAVRTVMLRRLRKSRTHRTNFVKL